ncbi:MAG TPA: twin-arginine translocase subunit TatC [candidate division Zixibacteria bacterium]
MASVGREMSFLDHLEELRKRIIRSLIAVVIFSVAAYYFSSKIIDFVTKPLPKVYFMSPTEGFMIRIKIAIIVGVIVSAPVILYQLWRFIAPGLFKREIRTVGPILVFSTFFFFAGGSLCFFLVIPTAVKFLLAFGTEKLQPLMKISDYISFVGFMVLAFGAAFELPIVSYFLAKMGILGPQIMIKGRRYAVVGILILAGVLTPSPDVFSQLMLAVPLYFLYEVSIIIVKVVHKNRLKKGMEQ